MSAAAIHKEIAFEDQICVDLSSSGWLYVEDDAQKYDRARVLLIEDCVAWVQGAFPAAWQSPQGSPRHRPGCCRACAATRAA